MKPVVHIFDESKHLLYFVGALFILVAATAVVRPEPTRPFPNGPNPGYGLLTYTPLPEPVFAPLASLPQTDEGSGTYVLPAMDTSAETADTTPRPANASSRSLQNQVPQAVSAQPRTVTTTDATPQPQATTSQSQSLLGPLGLSVKLNL